MKLFVVNIYQGIIVFAAESAEDVVEMMRGDKHLWNMEFKALDGTEWPMEDILSSIHEVHGREVTGPKGIIAYYQE